MTGYRRIILTGGIGAGKSYVARQLSLRGWDLIEADRIGHDILDGAAYGSVAARWPEVVDGGSVDRSLLAGIVFSDPSALHELEEMTHPLIRAEILRRADVAVGRVAVEIPLLRDWFEGWPVVVVMAPRKVRIERLRRRGMEDDDIERRIAAQPDDSEWRAAADFVIDNDGRPLGAQLEELERFADGFSVTDDR